MDFAITGKKIVSPQVVKKPTLTTNKPKTNILVKTINKPVFTKTVGSTGVNKKPEIKVQKNKQSVKKQVSPHQQIQIKNQTPIQKPPVLKVQQQPPTNIIQDQVKPQPKIYQIMVRYNHYKDKFPAQNNILKYQVIQNKYNFADVFKGNYLPKLQFYRNYSSFIQPLTEGKALQYTWQVQEGKEYQITIMEDEQEQNKYEKKIYIAPKQQNKCNLKKNKRAQELTEEMKKMSIQQLGSQKHKMLLQQRALQQDLYS